MFFIFNKPKIFSYFIVLSTVVVLFFTAEVLSEANNIETLTVSSEVINSEILERIDTNKKQIAITIDCLDDDKNIREILDIIEKNDIQVSFGISKEWIKKYPQLVKEIDLKGNSVVILGDRNTNFNNLNYSDIKENIYENIKMLEKLLNKEAKLIRYPYGYINENIMKVAAENGYTIIGWSIDTLDYEGLEGNIIWDNIKNKITNGDIILMNSNAEHIIDELNIVINGLKQRGYEIVKL